MNYIQVLIPISVPVGLYCSDRDGKCRQLGVAPNGEVFCDIGFHLESKKGETILTELFVKRPKECLELQRKGT